MLGAFTDAGNSNITRLLLLMPMAWKELVFWVGEGDREERRKEKWVIDSIWGSDYDWIYSKNKNPMSSLSGNLSAWGKPIPGEAKSKTTIRMIFENEKHL